MVKTLGTSMCVSQPTIESDELMARAFKICWDTLKRGDLESCIDENGFLIIDIYAGRKLEYEELPEGFCW